MRSLDVDLVRDSDDGCIYGSVFLRQGVRGFSRVDPVYGLTLPRTDHVCCHHGVSERPPVVIEGLDDSESYARYRRDLLRRHHFADHATEEHQTILR